jgi:hypothetical protein
MKCWIFPDEWKCGIETAEVPLEACRLCVEYRFKREKEMIRRKRDVGSL